MCGIVGYVGEKDCVSFLMDGLQGLEYRGYDSAGLAVHNGREVTLRRAAGRLEHLRSRLAVAPVAGTTGIGHTRWATHGAPTEHNAHPHRAGGVCVVHNGIIENHAELRAGLAARERVARSDTDTELVALLVEEALETHADLRVAVGSVLPRLRGSYALAIMYEADPDRIIVARRSSPLVVGIADGEAFCSSDVPAIARHAREVYYLEDGDLADLRRGEVRFFGDDGVLRDRQPEKPDCTDDAVDRAGFAHHMLKEMHEQPVALRNTVGDLVSPEALVHRFNAAGLDALALAKVRRVVFLACGTSLHAGMLGRYYVESLSGVPTMVEVASEFRNRSAAVGAGDLVIAVSQSGETVDTLAAVKRARSLGAPVLAVTNVRRSALARLADAAIFTAAGPEIGVASTKCFVTQVSLLLAFALRLGMSRNLSDRRVQGLLDGLRDLPVHMQSTLEVIRPRVAQVAAHVRDTLHMLFIGRGINYPVALEGALKLKEVTYIHAEGYAAGELKHGPIALVDSNLPVVVVAPDDESYDRVMSNASEVSARGGRLIVVGNHEPSLGHDFWLPVPKTLPELSCLLGVLPLQLLAYHVACMRGLDVDKPRNLAKTVTVE